MHETAPEESASVPCDSTSACKCIVKIATWNINHLAKKTHPHKKEAKLQAVKNLLQNDFFTLDLLALQEVNKTFLSPENKSPFGSDIAILANSPLLTTTSYTEYYPLLTTSKGEFTIEKIELYWSNGNRDVVTKAQTTDGQLM
ncbi:MAG: hypothetical protein JOZ54_20775, partial [Acidobacteria bacterium]|nr:hypothetical protein [Acidobacteriota bacterium]